MTDVRKLMARAIDDFVRQALRDFDISEEVIKGDVELFASSLLTVDAALAALDAAGWQCVPKEATEEMRRARDWDQSEIGCNGNHERKEAAAIRALIAERDALCVDVENYATQTTELVNEIEQLRAENERLRANKP